MRGTGYVIQWSNEKRRGTIHLGGKGHSALLSFVLTDCDAGLKKQLRLADIPSAAAIRVQFGLSIRSGNVLGAPVSIFPVKRVVRAKSGGGSKRRRRS